MKKKFMKAGACVLSAAMIMGLYAGPAFADWVENQNGARMWVQDGKAQTGWQQINGKWYYFDESGTMLTGWHKIDGKWYYLDPNGIMLTGWLKDDSSGDWYYLSPNGDMVSGVMELDGRIYYLGSPDSGRMETGTIRVNGRNYTFGENGEATDYKKPSAERTFQTVRNADGTLSVSETTSQKYYMTSARPWAWCSRARTTRSSPRW